MTEGSDATMWLCRSGAISPEVAMARLLFLGHSAASIGALLARDAGGDRATERMRGLLESKRPQLARLAAALAAEPGDGGGLLQSPSDVAAFFDRAVAVSAEASVALYSLADPAILAAATTEVVAWLRSQGWLGGDVLDLGCGFGRIAAALADACRTVEAIDVSPAMIAEAVARHANLPNVSFAVTSGLGLSHIARASKDLVIAVDSFPYVVGAGEQVARRHIADIGSILRPGGWCVILNLSYRGDDSQDERDLLDWTESTALSVACAAERPFTLWDGTAYTLKRGAGQT